MHTYQPYCFIIRVKVKYLSKVPYYSSHSRRGIRPDKISLYGVLYLKYQLEEPLSLLPIWTSDITSDITSPAFQFECLQL